MFGTVSVNAENTPKENNKKADNKNVKGDNIDPEAEKVGITF